MAVHSNFPHAEMFLTAIEKAVYRRSTSYATLSFFFNVKPIQQITPTIVRKL